MFFLPIKLALLLKNILACLHKEMYKEQLKNHHNKKDCIKKKNKWSQVNRFGDYVIQKWNSTAQWRWID